MMIQIKNLTKKYEDTIIFDNADYTFPDSGLICMLGASGSGKSTLLNMLAGFDSNYSGTIMVGDIILNKLKTDKLCAYRRDHIGFIFQDYHLLSGYTVLENILLSSELRDTDMHAQRQKAKTLLESIGLSDKQNQKIENLSGGQKQRVAIARALMGDPSVILADEPTGALDRENSTEIMTLLKGIAKDKLVIVITHDKKICAFADEIIAVEDGRILCKTENANRGTENGKTITLKSMKKVSAWKRGIKNFIVHIKRYISVGLAISIGIFCFILSLSFGNVMEQSISDFKEKNTAFNNGYVKIENGNIDKVFDMLQSDERIDNVYRQYKLSDITLKFNGKTETMAEKYPMPKAKESMSYGVMPKMGQNQIALSPSLAKKFISNINDFIGNEVMLVFDGREYKLTVSGIFNAGYDDFFVSSDLEQELYHSVKEDCYSVSYDVKNFEDIVPVNKMLHEKGIDSKNATKEVEAFQNTFQTISRLFLIVSVLILAIGLFISAILLIKLQNSRYNEVGLLSALGFDRRIIRNMIISENLFLSVMAGILNSVWISTGIAISVIFNLSFQISVLQIVLSIVSTFMVIVGISLLASYKLIHTEPADALRK